MRGVAASMRGPYDSKNGRLESHLRAILEILKKGSEGTTILEAYTSVFGCIEHILLLLFYYALKNSLSP